MTLLVTQGRNSLSSFLFHYTHLKKTRLLEIQGSCYIMWEIMVYFKPCKIVFYHNGWSSLKREATGEQRKWYEVTNHFNVCGLHWSCLHCSVAALSPHKEAHSFQIHLTEETRAKNTLLCTCKHTDTLTHTDGACPAGGSSDQPCLLLAPLCLCINFLSPPSCTQTNKHSSGVVGQ